MVFLVDGDRILTLTRSEKKAVYPGKVSGFGGKVEPGENMEASARREFLEEAGITVETMEFRGTIIRILDSGHINEMYIYVATGPHGKPWEACDEGTIAWRTVDDFLNHPDIVDHIPLYLKQVIEGTDFYCGVAAYEQHARVGVADNKAFFDARR